MQLLLQEVHGAFEIGAHVAVYGNNLTGLQLGCQVLGNVYTTFN